MRRSRLEFRHHGSRSLSAGRRGDRLLLLPGGAPERGEARGRRCHRDRSGSTRTAGSSSRSRTTVPASMQPNARTGVGIDQHARPCRGGRWIARDPVESWQRDNRRRFDPARGLMPAPPALRVLVADDQAPFRKAARAVLEVARSLRDRRRGDLRERRRSTRPRTSGPTSSSWTSRWKESAGSRRPAEFSRRGPRRSWCWSRATARRTLRTPLRSRERSPSWRRIDSARRRSRTFCWIGRKPLFGQEHEYGLDPAVDVGLPREPELQEDRVNHLLDRVLGDDERSRDRSV